MTFAPSALDLETLLAEHVRALGGLEILASKSCFRERARHRGVVPLEMEVTCDERGHRIRVEVDVPSLGGRRTDGYDGGLAWEVSPSYDGWHGAGHPASRQRAGEAGPLWCARLDGRGAPRLLGMAEDSRSRLCHVVERLFDNGAGQLVPQRDYVDPETFLVRETRGGEDGEAFLRTFDDYRPVERRQHPFRGTWRLDVGENQIEVQSVEFVAPEDHLFRHPTKARPSTGEASDDPNEASLRTIWEIVDGVYFDPSFGGVDWAAVGARYLPRARGVGATGGKEFVALAMAMLGELGATHFYVMERARSRTGETGRRKTGRVGFSLRWTEGAAAIWSIRPGSPAASSPLRRGFVVCSVNGEDDAAMRARHGTGGGLGHTPNEESMLVGPYSAALRTFEGDEVTIGYLDGNGGRGDVTLVAAPRPAHEAPDFQAELRGIDLLVSFDAFFGDVPVQLRQALDAHPHARGLVLDLRGNPGGIAHMPGRIAGLLAAPNATLGRMIARREASVISIVPDGPHFEGPVAVLVDCETASCAELLTASLQEVGRVRVFGRRTAGAVLPATSALLSNGCSFTYVISDYVTHAGRRLEGTGIVPDEPVALRRADLLASLDADMEAALAWLEREERRSGVGS